MQQMLMHYDIVIYCYSICILACVSVYSIGSACCIASWPICWHACHISNLCVIGSLVWFVHCDAGVQSMLVIPV